jgi:predicted nucleic acid-binding protein
LPAYFADTSALLKLYLPEVGTTWLLLQDLTALGVSSLVVLEVRSALARRQHEGSLSPRATEQIWKTFARGANQIPLRTLDALQLASALEFQRRARQAGAGPIVLLTADDRLEAAAVRAGLAVENPNRHV